MTKTHMKSLLLLGTLITSVLSSFGDAPSHSAVKPVPRNDGWWKDRAKLLDDRLKQTTDTQVLFIGDSITQGWEGDGKDIWTKYYGPRKAVNLGIGGDRTQHVLWRLDNAPLEGLKPKAAVVMIGTNNSNSEDNTAEQIVDGVTAIVSKLRARLPNTKVLLLAIFPRGENFNAQRGKITQINQVLEKLGDGKSVFFLDIGHRFLSSNGMLPGEIMPDYLHLSPSGYQIWAEAIEPKLTELLGEK
jgi:beta-glucosidase